MGALRGAPGGLHRRPRREARKPQTNDRATVQWSFVCGWHASPAAARRRVERAT